MGGKADMARVKLDLPERFDFSIELPLRIYDINYGGHLANDRVLALAQEARIRFLQRHGFSEADAGGAGLIMTDAVVAYRAQGFHGDVLRVEAAVAEPGRAGFDFVFRLTNAATGQEVARGKTGMAFFDYRAGKIVAMPEAFRRALAPAPKA